MNEPRSFPRRSALLAIGAGLLEAGLSKPSDAQGIAPGARSAFDAHSVDAAALEKTPFVEVPFSNGVKIRAYTAIDQPNCQVIVEDFMPGTEFWWTFPHDEFQYAISGEMDLEVWLPPLYNEKISRRVNGGDVYVYPLGARKHVRILGNQPFRHICFCPPSPGYPFPRYADVKARK